MSDGGGLFLVVQPTGSKLWRQQYRFQGKFKLLSHGPYPTVTLLEARKKRDDAKALLAKNIDPSDHQKSTKRQARSQRSTRSRPLRRNGLRTRREAGVLPTPRGFGVASRPTSFQKSAIARSARSTPPKSWRLLERSKSVTPWCWRGGSFRYAVRYSATRSRPSAQRAIQRAICGAHFDLVDRRSAGRH